jgi:hypothetical protein
MATKNDPGPYDCYAKLADDEPYFLLRAKDPVGPFLVSAWAATRAGDVAGAVQQIGRAAVALQASGRALLPFDSAKSVEARQCARAMLAWQQSRPVTVVGHVSAEQLRELMAQVAEPPSAEEAGRG